MMAKNQTQKKQGIVASVIEFVFLLLIVFLVRTFIFGLYQVPTGSMETTMLVGERFLADKFSYIFRQPRRGEIIAFNDPEFKYSDNILVKLFQRYVWGPANWTKRVIGVPGDVLRGVIEDGKPVIYRNGEKLDESYINQYPLIRVWRQDLDTLRQQIEDELQGLYRGRRVDQAVIERYMWQRLSQQTTVRSYDSSVSYAKQPFYRIEENRVCRDEQGNPELLIPGTPLPSVNTKLVPEETRNNWNRSDVFFIKLGADEYWCMGDNRLGSHDCRFFGPIKEQHIHGRIVFLIWSIDSDESWWIVDLIKHPIDFWTRVRWNRFFKMMN
jgi:signal peptidase I